MSISYVYHTSLLFPLFVKINSKSIRNANNSGAAHSDIEEQVVDKVVDTGYYSASSSTKRTNSRSMSPPPYPPHSREREKERNIMQVVVSRGQDFKKRKEGKKKLLKKIRTSDIMLVGLKDHYRIVVFDL